MLRPRPRESIREAVQTRLAPAYIGAAQQAVGAALFGDGFKSAPLLSPPIATGLTESLEKVVNILTRELFAITSAEYAQIPGLLRRIKHLLRVYYDAKLTKRKTSEFKYCDVKTLNDVGLKLHEVGLNLQFNQPRFGALLKAAPEMESFILEEQIDIGKYRVHAAALEEHLRFDVEAEDKDRDTLAELEEMSGSDLAAYQFGFFMGDVLVALIMRPMHDQRDKTRAKKAMEILVELSTVPMNRRALGDNLTDAMLPIYTDRDLLVRFAHAGGLPALIGDWAQSMAKDEYCKTAVETLPSKTWDEQTEASLLGVMRELILKTEYDGEDFVTTPLFAKFMHEIYSRYGITPFERASSLSDRMILFYFIHRRVSKRLERYRSASDWMYLLKKYGNVPRTTRRKHGWAILTLSGKWDCISHYGCCYDECPEKAALLTLREKRVRGKREAIVEERLHRWGAESLACSRCKHVSYCGASCQRADWRRHQPECKEEAAKGKNEDM